MKKVIIQFTNGKVIVHETNDIIALERFLIKNERFIKYHNLYN